MSSKKVLIFYAIFGFFIFGWVLKFGYFFSDDFTWLWHAQKITQLGDIFSFKMSSYYSPVVNLFYYLSYHLFYYQAAYYFLAGILAHILISFVLFLFLEKACKKRRPAVWASFFFLLAGSAYEPIIWIAANLHIFATFFILLFIYFYYQFLLENKIKYFILSFVYFILSLNTKEIAVICAPLMILTFIFFKLKNKNIKTTPGGKILFVLVFLCTAIYGFLEYSWQRNSSALSSGYWQLDFDQFLRWPVVIMDMFIPMFRWIDSNNHVYLYTLSFLAVILLIYFLRRNLLFWYGLLWLIISSLPTLFATDKWWMPLASRYTYLPKLGAAIILFAIIMSIQKKISKKIFYLLFGILFIYNLFYWVNIATKSYPYVYQSGRSLQEIVEEIGQINPKYVYMVYPFPFGENNAHIVGAFSTLIDYREEKIIFINKDDLLPNLEGVAVYWDSQQRKYFLKIYE